MGMGMRGVSHCHSDHSIDGRMTVDTSVSTSYLNYNSNVTVVIL
jgi:hypothetical protein